MRFLSVLFLAMPLAGFAMTLDTSKDASGVQNVCTSAHCERVNPLPAVRSRAPQKSDAEDNVPFADMDGPVQAKGGGGGGGGRGGGGRKGGGGGGVIIASSGNSNAGCNPLSLLRGPILLLNSILPTARAQASLGKSPTAPGGSGFVAPAEAHVDNTASHDAESAKHGHPTLRKDRCADILGFYCGSASKADTGPVGKLVKWMKSA